MYTLGTVWPGAWPAETWSRLAVHEDTFQFEIEAEDRGRIRLDSAYMSSRRGWPIPTHLDFDQDAGILTVRVPHTGGSVSSAALILQVTLPDIGELKLRTTLLLPREEPYQLMLELARERIRHFLQKCEDWHMFAPNVAPQAKELFDRAREHLAAAVLESDRQKQVAMARRSIVASVQAGELLAAMYADIILHRRFGASVASETSLGLRIDPRTDPPTGQIPGLREFGVCMIEVPWNLVQPKKGKFSFGLVDRWVEWAVQHKMPVVLGPLVDLREEVVPAWASDCMGEYQQLCTLLWEHQEQIVARYADYAAIWCVASGINVNRSVSLDLDNDQMIDLTRRAAVLVRQAKRAAKVLVELVHPFDDQVASCEHSVPCYEYAVRTLDEGVHVDCFGLVIESGLPEIGSEVRDLLSMSDVIDHIGRLERPIMITGMRVPSAQSGDLDGGGRWHHDWSEDLQARWATSMYGIALGKMTNRSDTARARPVGVVEGVLWSGLHDAPNGLKTGLLRESGVPRKAMEQLATVRRALRRPLKNAQLKHGLLSLDPEAISG